MSVDLGELLTDLAAETQVLDDLVADLPPAAWRRPTPAAGWSIHDQVSHLAAFDQAATSAMTDPERFRADAAALMALGPDFPDQVALRHRSLPPPRLLQWFRQARAEFLDQASQLDARARTPWFGPEMSVGSQVTARLMETWAHGQDVADTLGVVREPTARLRHIAHLGVRTLGFSYRLRGSEPPPAQVRVELAAPDGSTWAWGPDDAEQRVAGPALDFCLVVTQRRHPADTLLRTTGDVAAEWMSIAQVFAGAPSTGPAPRR
ncbi:TIGR03084 family metal-binding protein [Streptacidiphilus sp. PAMC 29251]